MSVLSEFLRLLADCVDTLRSPGATGAARWATALEDAGDRGPDDLQQAAARVLDLLESESDSTAPGFDSELEHEEFERRREHLSSLCRVILGR